MTPESSSPYDLPSDLPVPIDDGAAMHLIGSRVPPCVLLSTSGPVDLAAAAADRTVFFFYPRTGIPGQPPGRGFTGEAWDSIPGARGCTPQSCGYRDLHAQFAALGVAVYGVSTSGPEHQREFVQRTGMPFPMLSDNLLRFTRAMSLPTFSFPVESGGPSTLIRRMAWYVEGGIVQRVWYPVFPPDRNAAEVLEWVKRRGRIVVRPIGPGDAAYVRGELSRHWCSPTIWSRGRRFEADRLPGFVAEVGGAPAGEVTIALIGAECEIITLSSSDEGRGAGSTLLLAAVDHAAGRGCRRVFLTTSNDNLRALGFYQRRGFRIAAVYPRIIDRYREREPAIPRVSAGGIPVRDEIELERLLHPSGAAARG